LSGPESKRLRKESADVLDMVVPTPSGRPARTGGRCVAGPNRPR
jgi:hypothetical protein